MSRYNTPLRYPGGKQKLSGFILDVMTTNSLGGGDYVEPYAGGAGVALELLLHGDVARIHLNDSCVGVYAFWRSILTKTEEFCRRISSASVTIDEWRRQKEILSRAAEYEQIDVGFSMFYLNRCNRSGIVATGGVIGGVHQTGEWKMDARFPRNELIRRIEAIALKKNSIAVRNWDAEKFMVEYLPNLPRTTLVYCDPPYFHKAQRLYLNHYTAADHVRIADVIQRTIKQPWMVSYDNVPEIIQCYSGRASFSYDLQYHASRARKGSEVIFISDSLELPGCSSIPGINAALGAKDTSPAKFVRAG